MVRCLDTRNESPARAIFSVGIDKHANEKTKKKKQREKKREKGEEGRTQERNRLAFTRKRIWNFEFRLHVTRSEWCDSFREMFWIGFQLVSRTKLFYRPSYIALLFPHLFHRLFFLIFFFFSLEYSGTVHDTRRFLRVRKNRPEIHRLKTSVRYYFRRNSTG